MFFRQDNRLLREQSPLVRVSLVVGREKRLAKLVMLSVDRGASVSMQAIAIRAECDVPIGLAHEVKSTEKPGRGRPGSLLEI